MSYMNIFARLSVYDANYIIQAIQLISQQQHITEDLLSIVIDGWIKRVRIHRFAIS